MLPAFIVTLLPAIFSALEPALKGIFQGVIEFFGDLIIAGVLDLFGIDSDLANIFKSIFSLIGEVVGAAATFLLAPLASLAGARDTLSDIASDREYSRLNYQLQATTVLTTLISTLIYMRELVQRVWSTHSLLRLDLME